MKTGKTLTALAAELERQAASKKDYIADTRRLTFKPDTTHGVILDGVNGGMPLRDTAHAQMSATLQIPKAYYDRMRTEAPDLLARNANHWLAAQPAKKMIRTLDNSVRAVLSDRFRPLDNLDLAEAILPRLGALDAEVISGEVTERRFYLKATTARIRDEVSKGDIVQAGLVVSNSEIGEGRLSIEALTYRLVCLNGAIMESIARRAHVGGRVSGHEALEDAREYFTDATRQASDRAFFLQAQDAVNGVLTQERFAKGLLAMRKAQGEKLPEDIPAVMELAAKRYTLTDGERGSVLKHLIAGADLTQYGLANAITRASQDVDSYDRATELEKAGGEVFALPGTIWAKP
jgi:hypothetical protein